MERDMAEIAIVAVGTVVYTLTCWVTLAHFGVHR
jgi:hypothetical protein